MPGLQELVLVDPDPEAAAAKAMELLGVTHDELLAELNFRRQQREAKCLRDMVDAARTGRRRRLLRGADGGGEVEMMITPYSYHYWGKRLGYECWEDKQFRREYLQTNDAARIVNEETRVTIVNNFDAHAGAKQAAEGYLTRKRAAHLSPNKRRGRWAA